MEVLGVHHCTGSFGLNRFTMQNRTIRVRGHERSMSSYVVSWAEECVVTTKQSQPESEEFKLLSA